ncbi:MAG: PQQ-dependent sugar dehydrogenase [Verrucomicrobiae bacterium]|nr:PQQ-dependent sugar dehydrogenase [Verrucomicrobiae bacterium]
MRFRLFLAAFLLGSVASVSGADQPDDYASVPKEAEITWGQLRPLSFETKFDLPSGFLHLPDGTTVIACQRGLFHRVDLRDPAKPSAIYLDFREKMKGSVNFEDGIHGLALHPQFEKNGRLFLSYSQVDPRRTVLSEMRVDLKNDFVPLPETERVLLQVDQPLADHWGGQIVFGPDGFLYLGLGDGGLRDDPYRLAQNLWAWHGKILRLDIDRKQGAREYAIPADNPFVGLQLMREEIFASGLRNPWGMAFDAKTGHLWVADVGQDFWEEINRIEKGANYGWSDRDGPAALAAHPEPLLADARFIDPVFAYTRMRGDGLCIIGGYVYRGEAFPELENCYLFGDWGYGLVEAIELSPDEDRALRRITLYRQSPDSAGPFNPTFIGADSAGELVVLSQDGTIWMLERLTAMSKNG